MHFSVKNEVELGSLINTRLFRVHNSYYYQFVEINHVTRNFEIVMESYGISIWIRILPEIQGRAPFPFSLKNDDVKLVAVVETRVRKRISLFFLNTL